MSELDKFYNSTFAGERVIGTYLYPYRIFDRVDWSDPYSATAIVARINLESDEILVTCTGGLFIQPPAHLSDLLTNAITEPGKDLQAKLAFEEKTADVFNRIICELALNGIVSEPTTPVHISRGEMIDEHILITSASGGREMYLERTLTPSLQLHLGTWRTNQLCSFEVVNAAIGQECTSRLNQISSSLPTLVAGAYFMFSRRQLSEALVDGWIVIEQIIVGLWTNYTSSIIAKSRRERLLDSRTYSVGVRIETLYTIDVISEPLYTALNAARKHRNELAHRAKINLAMATEVLDAMKQTIEFFCKASIAMPLANVGVNW